MRAKATNTDGWIKKLGNAIGRLFSGRKQNPNALGLPMSEKEIDRDILLRVMTGVSNSIANTDWDDGLEYDLWNQALNMKGSDGCIMWLMAHRAKGWWIWNEATGEPKFITLREWSSHYASWRRRWTTENA